MASLRKLRVGRYSDAEIQDEYQTLVKTLAITVEKGTFIEMFQGTNRIRTLICLGINFFLQATGQIFVSVYGAVFIKDIGAVNPFTMKSINSAVNIVFNLISMLLTDYTGRK